MQFGRRVGVLVVGLVSWVLGGRAARAEEPALWPSIAPVPGAHDPTASNKDAALIVAIENYSPLQRVRGATRNGADWYGYLTETRGISPSRVRFLKDGEATKENIRVAAARISALTEAEGRAWIVFVGHGATGSDGKTALLVGADARATVESLDDRSVRQKELFESFAGAGARATFILDACFSGKASSGTMLVKDLQPVVAHSLVEDRTASHVFTAGHADQFAGPLPGAHRPAFSYLALGGLRGWADADHDGTVTPQELLAYTRSTLQALPLGRQQEPEYAGPDDRAVLAAGAGEPGPNLQTLIPRLPPPGTEEEVETKRVPARKGLVAGGFAVAGAGVVSLAVGSVFLAKALSRNGDSDPYCHGNTCAPEGLSLRHDAVVDGRTATWFMIGGLVGVAGGATLLWLGRPRTLEIAPMVGLVNGLGLRGAL